MVNQIKMQIGSTIVLTGLSDQLKNHVKKTLTVPNPHYDKMVRMAKGKARMFYGLKKEFKFYAELPDGSLEIPRGMRVRVLEFFKKIGTPISVSEKLIEKQMH